MWLAGTALAILVGMASSVIVNQVKRPATSYALGVGPDGTAQGNLAFATYAARQQKDPATAVSAEERALAAEAYQREPLSSAALGILIASMPRDGEEARVRQALLDIGGKLTRRSSLITSASIEAAARGGDEEAFFHWLSRATLTNESLRAAYIQAMAQATARPGAEAILVNVLGPKPTWSDRYWNAVVQVPQSLVTAAKLRSLVARPPWRQTEISEADRALALRLAGAGHFDAVRELAVGLGQARASQRTGNVIVNAQFDRPSSLPPIDWQLATSGNLGASINAQSKALIISAISGARGYAARQLVYAEPGAYVLDWALSSNAPLAPDTLEVRLACADAGPAAGAHVVPLAVGRHQQSISLASEPCRWFWLEINVKVADAGAGFDAQIEHLILRRESPQDDGASS